MTKTDMTENNGDKEGTKNPENGDSTACEEQRQKSRRARISTATLAEYIMRSALRGAVHNVCRREPVHSGRPRNFAHIEHTHGAGKGSGL